jgi:hypothetical protein
VRNAIAAIIGSLALASCALWNHANQRPLVGEWRYADATQNCQYVFAADGSFSGTVALRGKKISQFTGRWRLEHSRLMYVYTGDALGRIPPGSTDQDKLLAIAPDRFEIEAADGSRRTYRRVR